MAIRAEVERRKHERYRADGEVFLTFRPNFQKIGRIRDISQGGVAFEYTADRESKDEYYVEVDIFSTGKDFHLARIPCRVIYDAQIDSYASFSNMITRRCGLQFDSLNQDQISKLSRLCRSCTPLLAP
ncbi:MAG: PilZ domain-containing protein [Desulforhabdus sp.]|jgi:c-di-GMP-binding flagellar brake protein YcgR|nr:PilZ domain-containing protein [Desulforhabdus sp.]